MLWVGAVAAALDMEGDKIERRAGLPAIAVYTIGAVIQKGIQKLGRSPPWNRVGRGRAADTRLGTGRFHRRGRAPIALHAVANQIEDQIIPFLVVLRRAGPAKGLVVLQPPALFRGVIALGIGQVLGHEAKLDEWSTAKFQNRVKCEIDEGPVIDWMTRFIFQVGVRRAPFVDPMAVAGAKQMM